MPWNMSSLLSSSQTSCTFFTRFRNLHVFWTSTGMTYHSLQQGTAALLCACSLYTSLSVFTKNTNFVVYICGDGSTCRPPTAPSAALHCCSLFLAPRHSVSCLSSMVFTTFGCSSGTCLWRVQFFCICWTAFHKLDVPLAYGGFCKNCMLFWVIGFFYGGGFFFVSASTLLVSLTVMSLRYCNACSLTQHWSVGQQSVRPRTSSLSMPVMMRSLRSSSANSLFFACSHATVRNSLTHSPAFCFICLNLYFLYTWLTFGEKYFFKLALDCL